MLDASADMAAMVDSRFLRIAARLSIDLPAGGYTDFTLSIVSINWATTNTTDMPNGVAVEEGYAVTNGTVVLKGALDKRDSTKTPVWLLNPDDPTSPLYRMHDQVKKSPFVFKWGTRADGKLPELLNAITGKITNWDVNTDTGIITARFADVAVGWGQLPALSAIITVEPYNAGLTNEYVIDRIARNLPDPRLTWPLPRPQCELAVGFRTSIWPEIGSIITGWYGSAGGPSFAPGAFGSGLSGGSDGTHSPSYQLATGIGGTLFVEFWVTGCASGAVSYIFGGSMPLASNDEARLFVDSTGVHFDALGDTMNASGHYFTPMDDGKHYVALELTLPTVGASVFSGTIYFDGQSVAFTTPGTSLANARQTASWPYAVISAANGATVEAVQATTETAPALNYPFTPTAILDPSLNPLDAVPAIPAGTQAMDELQTIASSEGGYLFADNDGNLRFLNRKTITGQQPVRYLQQGRAMISVGSTVGATTQYDDVAIDYTEWSYGDKALLFSPKVKWRVDGNSTQEWVRDLPSGQGTTAALVDGTIGLLPDGHDPTDGDSWFLAAFDRYGNGTPAAGTVTAKVEMLTPSRVKITVTNRNAHAVWLVAPSSQATQPVGTVALWIGGIPATADAPTTVHITYTTAPAETFTAPSNDYRQDRDAAKAYGRDLYGWLRVALPDYTNCAIRPDPRLQVADMVTADLPIAGGKSAPAKALIWGQSISLDFSAKTATHQVSLRRFAPPGAWELGVSQLGTDNYTYPKEGAAA